MAPATGLSLMILPAATDPLFALDTVPTTSPAAAIAALASACVRPTTAGTATSPTDVTVMTTGCDVVCAPASSVARANSTYCPDGTFDIVTANGLEVAMPIEFDPEKNSTC